MSDFNYLVSKTGSTATADMLRDALSQDAGFRSCAFRIENEDEVWVSPRIGMRCSQEQCLIMKGFGRGFLTALKLQRDKMLKGVMSEKIRGCCDDPSCPCCHGSGLVDITDPDVKAFYEWLDKAMENEEIEK